MDSTAAFWLVTCLVTGLGTVIYLIAADKKRFLARFDLDQWRESYYLRALPNFLQALHDHHFRSPWPSSRNAVAALYFRYRTRPLLKRRSRNLRRAFINQHTILFGLLEVLHPYLQDFVFGEQQRLVANRILAMEDTIERDRLIAFLDDVRHHREFFKRNLTRYERHTMAAIVDRRLMHVLRTAHAIYQEHGFCLMPEFTQLRRWEEMSGVELVQELPVLPTRRIRKLSAARG